MAAEKSKKSVAGVVKASHNVYCSDKKLIPRIKEYVEESGRTDGVDVDDMASSLQRMYSEYGRKKKQRFRAWVSKVYLSLCRANQLEGVSSASPMKRNEEENWLECREKEHFEKRMREFGNTAQNGTDKYVQDVVTSSESEEEMEDLQWDEESSLMNLNTTNDSIIRFYGNQRGNKENGNGPPSDHVTIPKVTPTAAPTEEVAADSDAGKEGPTSKAKLAWKTIAETTPTVLPSTSGDVTDRTATSPQATPTVRKSAVNKKRDLQSVDGTGKQETGELKVKRRKRKEAKSVEEATITSIQEKKTSDFRVQTSSVRFSDVGGCEAVLREVEKLLVHLRHPWVFSWLGVTPPRGFLLHGPPGCGKTLLAHAIAGELQLPFIRLAATEVVSGVSGESESTLRDLFTLAVGRAPCVLFMDEIDAICQKRELARREMEKRIVTQLLACMDELSNTEAGSQVLVIGATSSPDSLDPALRRAGRFDREICLGIPDQPSRESILKVLGRGLRLEPDFSFYSVSRQTPGFVGADLVALVREASLCAVNRFLLRLGKPPDSSLRDGSSAEGKEKEAENSSSEAKLPETSLPTNEASFVPRAGSYSCLNEELLADMFITAEDFTEALGLVQPSAKREGFATVPDVTWDDVGALEDIREELSLAILAPVRFPEEFARLGLTSPPGILLAGPPGCGKTLLAKAIANESGINFISVKGPELLNMYVGESERAVRQVFQRARNSSPCVIFFDELDALCPRRSDISEGSASSRVVNQLLTEMDGLVARKQVFIMGATNRPDIIDPAVLRPGRLDKVLYVGLPNAKDRAAILSTITKLGTKPKLSQDVDIFVLASDQNTKGYTGADMSALVREAAITALKEHMNLKPLEVPMKEVTGLDQLSSPTTAKACVVEMKHFLQALVKLKPSVSAKEQLFYNQMADRFST